MSELPGRTVWSGTYEKRPNVEIFEQAGPGGCQTACLANIERFYFDDSHATPQGIDDELGREPDDTLPPLAKMDWIFSRGLRDEVMEVDESGFTDYLDGVIEYEQLMKNIAKVEFGGSLEKAYAEWGGERVKRYWDEQKSKRGEITAKHKPFKDSGQFIEIRKKPEFGDIQDSVNQGKLVLATLGNTAIVHQILCMPGVNDNFLDIYIPGEAGSQCIVENVRPESHIATEINYDHGLDIVSRMSLRM